MKRLQKTLILALALWMLIGCLPPAALAAEEEPASPETTAEPVGEEGLPAADATPEPSPAGEEDEPAADPLPQPEDAAEETEPDAGADAEPADTELPAPYSGADALWQRPGNTDAEIQNGGTMLTDGDVFYYSENGVWSRRGDVETLLAEETDARNLNLGGGYLYYTAPYYGVCRVPADGGAEECVLPFDGVIDQLYLIGAELRFVAGGKAYSYNMDVGELASLDAPAGVEGLIPTQYGNLFLTGDVFDRTLWAGTTELLSGVESCYTDSGCLVVNREGTWQVALTELFEGRCQLQAYTLHAEEAAESELSFDEQLAAEAAYFESEEYEQLQEVVEFSADGVDAASTRNGSSVAYTALSGGSATQNQINMCLRARQMAEVKWTPLRDRYSWGGNSDSYVNNNSSRGARVVADDGTVTYGYFAAGKTYTGIPYAQAVYTGYVGWSLSIDSFINAINNSESKFYSGYSTYSRVAPYYGSDCSAFVAWAWNLPARQTCTSLTAFSSKIGNSISAIRLGDSLNCTSSHVMLVTDIGYDASGNIVSVEITEQTPCKMRVTCYGAAIPGKTYKYTGTLSTLQSYYLNSGYYIYRRTYSGSVGFTESSAVPLEDSGWLSAPKITYAASADGAQLLVTLSTPSGHAIHYTTDGSQPTASSPTYTEPFGVSKSCTVRAMAEPGDDYKGSFELNYDITVTKTKAPALSLVSGSMFESKVSEGAFVTLFAEGAERIYYTTDGTEPTKENALMTDDGIEITEPLTLKAFAVGGSSLRSDIVSFDITFGDFHTITVDDQIENGAILPSGAVGVLAGADITLTLAADEGYKIKDVLVDGVSVGAKSSYTFEKVDKDHTISASFSIDLPFGDVKDSSWYADEVAFAYTNNFFKGITTSTFEPNSTMNRGMFITVLGRMAGVSSYLEGFTATVAYANGYDINIRNSTSTGSSAVGTIYNAGDFVAVYGTATGDGATWYRVRYNGVDGYVRKYSMDSSKQLILPYSGSFTDLGSTYYTGYIQWAYMYGVINGVSSTTFAPKNEIKRQDICVVLYNYLTKYCNKSVTASTEKFTDESSISSYASTAVHAMQKIGVVGGYPDGSFRPGNSATRAEVAAMFMRLYDYLH